MSVTDLLLDFAFASVLILIGQFLRSKVGLFQRFFIPASLLAGFLGLALGPQGLKVLPFSALAGSYSGLLIVLIFTVVGINGFETKNAGAQVGRVGGFMFYKFICLFLQIALPIAATLTLLKVLSPGLNDGFGILMASGFDGGHGTAAAVGAAFDALGWKEATDIGMTFATIGLLTGIFGGLAFVKWATVKGHTKYIKDFRYISGDLRTGLIPKENRSSIGEETTASVSIDTLCYHTSLIVAVAGAGILLNRAIALVLPGVPDFTVAYLLSVAVFLILRKTPVYQYIDTRINNRIAGTCTDYVVFFGIASIKIPIVIEYAVPLLVMTLIGFVCVFVSMVPLGYLFNKKSWFERSLFVYGYSTGVFAIGFVLLRIVDPDNKSLTIEDTAMTPFQGFVEVAVWSLIPVALINGQGWLVVGISAAAIVACFVLSAVFKMIYRTPLSERGAYGIEEEEEAAANA